MIVTVNGKITLRINSSVDEFMTMVKDMHESILDKYRANRIEAFELLMGSSLDSTIGATLIVYFAIESRVLHWSDKNMADDSIHLYSGCYVNCQMQYNPEDTVRFTLNGHSSIVVQIDDLESLFEKSYQHRIKTDGSLEDLGGLLHLPQGDTLLQSLDFQDFERFMRVVGELIANDEPNQAMAQRLPDHLIPIDLNFDSFGYTATEISVAALCSNTANLVCCQPEALH